MSTFVRASYVPLFERLCGDDGPSSQARVLEGPDLRASLRRDLLRLLSSRNGLTIAGFLEVEGSVWHYGLPDLLGLSVQSDKDLQVMAGVVGHAIALFEPRLSAVTVSARRDPRRPERACVTVSAQALLGRTLQRVDFDMALDDPGLQTDAVA